MVTNHYVFQQLQRNGGFVEVSSGDGRYKSVFQRLWGNGEPVPDVISVRPRGNWNQTSRMLGVLETTERKTDKYSPLVRFAKNEARYAKARSLINTNENPFGVKRVQMGWDNLPAGSPDNSLFVVETAETLLVVAGDSAGRIDRTILNVGPNDSQNPGEFLNAVQVLLAKDESGNEFHAVQVKGIGLPFAVFDVSTK